MESDIRERFGESQGKLYLSKINELIVKDEHNLDISDNQLRAREASFTLKCMVTMFLKDYIFAIILVLTVIGWLWYKLSQCLRNRRIDKLSRGLY